MEIVLLAGGFGTRLRSVVSDVPKPMAPVNGRPFLEILLDKWIGWGASHFILSVGYLHEVIINHFGDSYKSIPISYTIEDEPLGTGGALVLASQKLKTQNEFAVQNGDTYFDIDFQRFREFHLAKKSYFTIALRKIEKNTRYSSVNLNETGRIVSFSPSDQKDNVLVNGGIYLVFPALFKNCALKYYSLEEDLLPSYIIDGVKMCGLPFDGYFIDIGIPETYINMLNKNLERKSALVDTSF